MIFEEIDRLKNNLDFHLERHGVLASNLANANTPGYKAVDLRFSEVMQLAKPIAKTHDKHFQYDQQSKFEVNTFDGVEGGDEHGHDENGIQVEQAVMQISANRLRYETALEVSRRRIAILRYAAGDGNGGGV